MRNKFTFISTALSLFLILLTYRAWFTPGLITAGDFWSNSRLMYIDRSVIQYAWDWAAGSGLGANSVAFLWIHLSLGLPVDILGKLLGLDWAVAERIWYLFPFIIIGFLSPLFLFKKIFPNSKFFVLAPLIYILNTYILMVVGGGQLHGIGMAYVLIPAIYYFTLSEDKSFIKQSLIIGLLLGIQLVFDLRVFYLTVLSLFGFLIFLDLKKILHNFIKLFVIPLTIVMFLHAFWILPLIIYPTNPIADLGTAYSAVGAVNYFSFAKFENSISLLHPNWPDNVFGKVGFMNPGFLIFPILAFSCLFFLSKIKDIKTRKYILFFSFLALVAAFLAKGSNDPFGNVYILLFQKFPGFQMYRDPTKFYALVALAFSILIPFSLENLYECFNKDLRLKFVAKIFVLIILSCLLFLISPAILGKLTGTFKVTQVPDDYVKFEQFLSSQNSFSRTLWVPTLQRFGYDSNVHPPISAFDYYKTSDIGVVLKDLNKQNSKMELQLTSVKYIIIPDDSEKEIYIADRKYSEQQYLSLIGKIRKIGYLHEITGFGRIKVFVTPNYKDHFWDDNPTTKITYKLINPAEYIVNISGANSGDNIIFSEGYDRNWVAINGNKKIISKPFDSKFNSFQLMESGSYQMKIFYQPQKWVDIGSFISLAALILVSAILVAEYKKK